MKGKRIEHAKEAILNLKQAIAVLLEEGAAESAIAPYRANLSKEENLLRELEGKTQ